MKELKNIVGAHFLFGLEGTTPSQKTLKLIKKLNPAGFILMQGNCESPEQIFNLTQALQKVSSEPLILSVDQEGGRVARLKDPFLKLPPAQKIGEMNSPKYAFELFNAVGKELKSVGINLDFAPVCDIFTNPQNKVIADRAFGKDSETVASLASAATRGLQKAEILACAKHFPGHGDTVEDSHEELPQISHTLKNLEKRELIPFQRVIKGSVSSIMPAHLICDALDPNLPVTLSHQALSYLREDLRFSGLIISDDMNMGAIAKSYDEDEALYLACEAGIDILLYCDPDHDHHEELFELLYKKVEDEYSFKEKMEGSYLRLQKIKSEFLINTPKQNQWKQIIGCQAHKELESRINQ